MGTALRIGTELVAAMIVGVGGGLLLDRWLGTAPWGLIVMFFLGAAAGVLNVYRAVTGLGIAAGYSRPTGDNERQDGDAH
ncbi:AtpZ/AtpI family protein [Azospirillum doebereinerae]|uniref:AtpZ/AtpI family protein n=1 Tax=Azospirillum doebereinerae TaxID=92933 RepID=UPI001EE4F6E9|nr:AtpZ/AtpI family protein [Azospirillum doebereinerae]MCG5240029.1 AtpZ/AtpI family protein [Azospirillum doebereinerae]